MAAPTDGQTNDQLTEITTPASANRFVIGVGTVMRRLSVSNFLIWIRGQLKLDDLAAPDDNTDLNASTSRHGLLPKLSGNSSEFLNGSGAWSTPAGSGGGTISSGAGAPSSTPGGIGYIYIDTTNNDAYIAVGTASSSDWEKSNDGVGTGGATVTSGEGPPSSTPSALGSIYIDTTNNDAYTAVGTTSSADWEKNNDGGGSVTGAAVASAIHAATGKTTPADADEFGQVDSADSNAFKKLTWANLKAAIKTYLNGAANTWTEPQTFSSVVMAISSARTPANTGRAITSSDFGKTITVTAGTDQTFSTPDSATSPDGAEVFFIAYGVGDMVLNRAGTDTVDSTTGIKMTSKRKRYRVTNCIAETNWEIESIGDWE